MALRMSQMLRSSREVRRSSPGVSPGKRDALLRKEESPAEAGAGKKKEEGAVAQEERSVFDPVGLDPVLELSSPLSPKEEEEGEASDAASGTSREAEVYGRLVEVAEMVFAAAAEGSAPDEAALLAVLRQVLEMLRQGDELLSETVRQRQESRTLPRRAANTVVLAVRIGMEIGYDERRCMALGLCALVHDLGMLKVPEDLFNSRRLTPEQVALLHRHPIESQKMVAAFGPSFNWIGKIVVQVHERRDGSGYPQGLRGDQIHEMARIIGLADTYEAMAHPRADREARVTYHALKEIIDQRNALFERRLIKALINIVSIFPLGSLVKLNNGEIGRVIGTSRMHPTRPKLEILVDARGQRLAEPRQIDLEDEPMLYIVDPAIEEEVLGE